MLELPALPPGIVDGYRALPDLTGIASDAMDELGIVGAVPAAVLRPNDPTARVVGRALTVRNIPASAPVPDKVKSGVSGLGEIEAHNLAEPGDVLVVQGVDQVSNLGGMSATIGHRQGEIGADCRRRRARRRSFARHRPAGLVAERQPDHRQMARRDRRHQQAGHDLRRDVNPGDLVLADETGVCFIPRERAAEVLARAQRNVAAEKLREDKIASGVPIAELIGKAK